MRPLTEIGYLIACYFNIRTENDERPEDGPKGNLWAAVGMLTCPVCFGPL